MASHDEVSSRGTLQAAVQSLPSYQLVDKDGEAQPVSNSRMVAIAHAENRRAAIIMTDELLKEIKAHLDDGVKAIVQEHSAKTKNGILQKFEDWAQEERNELAAQMKVIEAIPGSQRLQMSLHLQQSMLDDKLVLAEKCRARLEEEIQEAERIAEDSKIAASARLYDIFKAHGFTDNEAAAAYDTPPDDECMRKWAVPEQEEIRDDTRAQQDDANSQHQHSTGDRRRDSGRASYPAEQARGRSASRRRSRSASPRRHNSHDRISRDRSIDRFRGRRRSNDYAATPPPRQNNRRNRDPSYEPLDPHEMAQRDFHSRARDLQGAQCDFEWHWGKIKQSKNETASEAGRREFKANNHLTRKLTEAWERFREARRHYHDLGARVPYDNQSSSFPADSEDGEEQFRVFMKPFCGPDKHPWVDQWLDDVEEGHDSAAAYTRRDSTASPEPETVEWDVGSDLCPWDSLSVTAEGREKDRIRVAEAARDSMRADAVKHHQEVTASKRKRDAGETGEGEGRDAKAQKTE